MALYRKQLENGVYYNHIKTDRFKTTYFCVNYIMPLEYTNVAYYTVLPRILERGCAQYPTMRALARKMEELYGTTFSIRNSKVGNLLIISFYITTLDNAYLPSNEQMNLFFESFELLREVMLRPFFENGDFATSYVEGEIRNAADNKRAVINNKQTYAYERCLENMYRGKAYGIPHDGFLEQYETMDKTAFLQYYNQMLSRARVEMFFVGNVDTTIIEPQTATLFTDTVRCYREIESSVQLEEKQDVNHIEETVQAEQGKLVMGYRTHTVMPDDDSVAFTLFNEIFGASPTSKLFMNVREKKSLCYSCASTGDISIGSGGSMFVMAGIDNQNLEIVVEEVEKQLDNIRQGHISEIELERAKKSLINGYRSLPDSASGISNWYMRRILGGLVEEPEDLMKRIENLQVADVIRVSKKVVLDTVYFLKGIKSEHNHMADAYMEEE